MKYQLQHLLMAGVILGSAIVSLPINPVASIAFFSSFFVVFSLNSILPRKQKI